MDFDQPERLLDHGQLVRALAGALLHEEADVDDVVQGTWTAAMAGSRPAGWPLPRWLAGVARNLARHSQRDRRRRAAREEQAARPESLRSTAEVVELEELRQRVVAAVFALGEPQRSVVLLRFYDGLPPRAIARRLGMEPATVRSHLHRALATLRARLDRDWRGGRAAWGALLLPLLDPGTTVRRHLTMTRKATLWTLLAAAPIVCWQLLPATPAPARHDAAAVERTDTAASALPATAAAAPRIALEAPPATTQVAKPAVLLRFLDRGSEPVPGDLLRQRFEGARTAATAILLDAAALDAAGIDGIAARMFGTPDAWRTRCDLEFTPAGAAIAALPGKGTFQLLIARPHAAAMLTPAFELPAAAPLAFDVPLPAASALRTVRFLAADTGAPLAGAAVRFYTEFGDDQGFVAGTGLQTDARGECVLAAGDVPHPRLIRPALCWLEGVGHAGRVELGGDASVREVRVEPRGKIEGTAVLPGSAPAHGHVVAVAFHKGPALRARTGDDGRFAIDGAPATRCLVALLDAAGAVLRFQEVEVPPAGAAQVQLAPPAAGNSVRGRVTAGGEPLAGVLVAAARGRAKSMVHTAADGSYVLDGVTTGVRFAILVGDPSVSDDFGIQGKELLTFEPGAAAVLDFDLPHGCIPVRVVDERSGEPLAGVPVMARPKAATQTGRFPGFTFRAGWAVRTDATGAALLRCLPEGEAHELQAGGQHAGGSSFTVARTEVAAPTHAEAEPIVLRVARQ